MNGVRRFTAERRDCNGASIIGDAHNNWTIWFKTAELRDAFVAQVNGTRTDDLPAGVQWATVLDAGCDVPDGWMIPNWRLAIRNGNPFGVEVRPVQQPDTEIIDTRDAYGRNVPTGEMIRYVGQSDRGWGYSTEPEAAKVIMTYAPTVEVLKDGGRS